MISNICRANFNGGRTAQGNNRFQWDYGQILEISGIENLPDPFTAQFSNYPVLGTAKTAVGTGGSVEIPNEYFVSGQNIYCFIVLHTDEDDGRTVYVATIPVTKRPQPIDDPITPTQQSTIDTAIAALQAGVARAEGYAEAAEEQAGIAQSAATTATEAATRAEGAVADVEAAATRAEQAADGAAASATAASGSATSAAGSATAAAGSATTAGNKATEAAESATAAAGSATTAGASATAAQAAQTAAETAQGKAEDAQAAAEAAAQTLVIDPTLTQPNQAAEAKATGDAISLVKSQISDTTDNDLISFTQGKFIILNQATADITDLRTGANNSVAVVQCVPNDVFTINAQGGSASRAWGFVASNGNVLSVAAASVTVTNMVLTAPANAAYLVINDTANNGRRSYKNVLLKRTVNGIKHDIVPLYINLMEQGGFGTASGYAPILQDKTTEIRIKDYAPWVAGSSVSMKAGYQARMILCDANGIYLSVVGWGDNLYSADTVAAKVKVHVKKTSGADILPSEIYNAISYTDIPMIAIDEKAGQDDFEDACDKIEVLEDSRATYDALVPLTLEDGIMDTSGNITANTGIHASVSVSPGDEFILIAQKANSSWPAYLFFKGTTLVSYGETTQTGGYRSYSITVPSEIDKLVVNSLDADFIRLVKHIKTVAMPNSLWKGKKIAWFGTSIPAPSTTNPLTGYPEYVAAKLGATVYNEAVPSSMARGGFIAAITADDPYGWTRMGYMGAIRNMGSTVAEKQDMIDNWDSKWKALVGGNHDLTADEKTLALSCSYENKLIPYITNPVDLYVFDHGFNDWSGNPINMEPDENNPYNRATFQGAMNTYIRLIYTKNPRANIVMISHYESDERPGLIAVQKAIADYWNIPFLNLAELMGWCYSRKLTTDGYWKPVGSASNGIWIPSGGESTEYRLPELHMPDGRHPNLDASGNAVRDIGEMIIPFLNSIPPTCSV